MTADKIENLAVTIKVPGRFADWLKESEVAAGRDPGIQTDPGTAALYIAWRDREERKVGRGTQCLLTFIGPSAAVRAGLLMLREYGGYCVDANVNGEPIRPELDAARYVMQRVEAVAKEVFDEDWRLLP